MNLEQYFELLRPPFPRIATKEALTMTPAIEHVLARMKFALDRETIALLVAVSGCGKNTAISLFTSTLDAASYHVLTISLTTLGPFSLIAHLATNTGLPGKRFKGEAASALLMHFRSQPKRTIILIDEAQRLPDASLEDLRLLTADNLDRRSPFSLILVGQPALRDRLAEPHHDALWQRIGVRLRLRPLNENEIGPFLERHLKAAGCKRKGVFEPDAIKEIFHHSRGVPRPIQNIALEAMIAAMVAGKKNVDAEAVQQAIVDMEAT